MIKIINLINEALPLSRAKLLTRGWDNSANQLWFGKKYRIYLPLIRKPKINTLPSETQKLVLKTLQKSQYLIKDYIAGTAINTKYDRLLKIGKILTKLKSPLIQRFNNDSIRQMTNTASPLVVISRHPYDIAGMSTDRGWTSCKDLGTKPIYSGQPKKELPGMYAYMLLLEVHLLLIAYLIQPDDKNITHPIARVNIVPYYKISKTGGLIDQYIMYKVASNKVYGSPGTLEYSFILTVLKWVEEKQKSAPKGVFQIDDTVYDDEQDYQFNNMTGEDWENFEWDGGRWVGLGDRNEHDWIDGTWKTGIWVNGTWWNGVWQAGVWYDGIWRDGTWQWGTWFGGTWQEGVWLDGAWLYGTWEDGTWKNGTWHDGTWKDGTWLYGTWFGGTWQDGVWQEGTWLDGYWSDGLWLNGKWEYGTWLTGTWKDGIWEDGLWLDGTWEGGEWQYGTWKNGTWEKGTWQGGEWKDGLWLDGWISDPDLEGNFEPDWLWNDDLVHSPISPKEYFGK